MITQPFTVSSSFRFPTVPYHSAIHHIHTPEHLETIAPDYFKIQRVHPPAPMGEYVTVSLDCLVLQHPHTLRLLARPGQNHTCTYMCLEGGVRRIEIHMSVRPNIQGFSYMGHILAMETTYFARSGRVFSKYLQPTLGFLSGFENRTVLSSPISAQTRPHPNLEWYRRMVLGLPYDRSL